MRCSQPFDNPHQSGELVLRQQRRWDESALKDNSSLIPQMSDAKQRHSISTAVILQQQEASNYQSGV